MRLGRFGLIAGGLVLFGAAFVGGISAEYILKPSDLAKKAVRRVLPKEDTPKIIHSSVESTFLSFDSQTVQLPITRYARGGGLTIFNGEVLAITVDGKLFIARSAEEVQSLDIEVPDYGFADFRAFIENPVNAEYRPAYWGYRYADITTYPVEGGARLAISYTLFDKEKLCYRTVVSALNIPDSTVELKDFNAAATDWNTLYQTEPCLPLKTRESAIEAHMVGGRFAYDGVGTLYVTSGDYHFDGIFQDGQPIAQDPDYDYGKVIAIDVASGGARQMTRGHRNLQGITVDLQGRVWTVEHGMRGGDELNLEIEGRDYGWPQESLGTLYNKLPIPNMLSYGRHDVFEPPRFAFLPSVATSSLALIDGFHESWDGDLLMGTLKDMSLYRLRIVGDDLQFAERIPVGERVRAALQLDAERLVFFTDDNELVFLTRKDNAAAMEFLTAYLAQPELDDTTRQRLSENMNNCLQCHSLDPNAATGAPSLANVFGARLGKGNYSAYSEGFKGRSDSWTRELLTAYLADPQSVIAGTSMPNPGVEDPDEIAAIVDFLEATSSPLEFANENQ